VTLSFFPGAKIGVVGPNGAGKSDDAQDHGRPRPTSNNGDAMLAKGYTVGMLMQEPPLDRGQDGARERRGGRRRDQGLLDRYNEISDGARRPGRRLRRAARRDGRPVDRARPPRRVGARLAARAGDGRAPLPDPGDADVNILSGGEKRRVALCKLLLQQPDLLLLDEPTNHLDAESVPGSRQHLKSYPGAVLAVTHDRYFLDNVAGWICEIDRGQLHPYEGNYSTYLETKRERLKIEGKKDAKRAKILERELEWVRRTPRPARPRARRA
jgi:ATPase subunit of ABC transporter with duplicated ATPase domains